MWAFNATYADDIACKTATLSLSLCDCACRLANHKHSLLQTLGSLPSCGCRPRTSWCTGGCGDRRRLRQRRRRRHCLRCQCATSRRLATRRSRPRCAAQPSTCRGRRGSAAAPWAWPSPTTVWRRSTPPFGYPCRRTTRHQVLYGRARWERLASRARRCNAAETDAKRECCARCLVGLRGCTSLYKSTITSVPLENSCPSCLEIPRLGRVRGSSVSMSLLLQIAKIAKNVRQWRSTSGCASFLLLRRVHERERIAELR